MINLPLISFILIVLLFSGCSGEKEGSENGTHVWKGQTDTMDKAKEVQTMVSDQAEELEKSIEKQIQ